VAAKGVEMNDEHDDKTQDAFEAPAPQKRFADIRNQRNSVAEEKAYLLRQLGDLINRVPPSVASGGVATVRAWKEARKTAAAVAAESSASVPQITAQINNMRRFIF